MKKNMKRLSIILPVLFLLFSAIPAGAQDKPDLLPRNLVIEDVFKPGYGSPIGYVQIIQGQVVLIHAGLNEGYLALKGYPLFRGDAVITLEKSRARLSLEDGSLLTLASGTKMELSESVYKEEKKSRFAFLKMNLGRARFYVRKLVDFRRSEFKVRTPTAVVGVRGSDFVIEADALQTRVIALQDTGLELVSLAALDAEPTTLTDFQKVTVDQGQIPSPVESVTPEEVEQIDRQFQVMPETGEPEGRVITPQRSAAGKGSSGTGPPTGTGAPGTAPVSILVPQNDLVTPEPIFSPPVLPVAPDILTPDPVDEEQQIEDIKTQIEETVKESTEEMTELPSFPTLPE